MSTTDSTEPSVHSRKRPQEIFDATADYLFVQAGRAIESGSCRYRTSSGDCCAVGYWLPDELYRPQWDRGTSCSIETLFNTPEQREAITQALAKSGIDLRDPDTRDILSSLQRIHDGATSHFTFHDLQTNSDTHCSTRWEYLNRRLAHEATQLHLEYRPRTFAVGQPVIYQGRSASVITIWGDSASSQLITVDVEHQTEVVSASNLAAGNELRHCRSDHERQRHRVKVAQWRSGTLAAFPRNAHS